jgi:hypothetical protein
MGQGRCASGSVLDVVYPATERSAKARCGKKVKGRKRHIVTDTDGLLLAVQVHAANIQDVHGAIKQKGRY